MVDSGLGEHQIVWETCRQGTRSQIYLSRVVFWLLLMKHFLQTTGQILWTLLMVVEMGHLCWDVCVSSLTEIYPKCFWKDSWCWYWSVFSSVVLLCDLSFPAGDDLCCVPSWGRSPPPCPDVCDSSHCLVSSWVVQRAGPGGAGVRSCLVGWTYWWHHPEAWNSVVLVVKPSVSRPHLNGNPWLCCFRLWETDGREINWEPWLSSGSINYQS